MVKAGRRLVHHLYVARTEYFFYSGFVICMVLMAYSAMNLYLAIASQ